MAQDICEELARRGYELIVLTAHLNGLPRQETLQGVQIIRVPCAFRRTAFKAGLFALGGYVVAGLWAGLRLTKEWRPDLIHVHFAVPSGAIAWVLRRVRHIPYVLTAHLGDVPGGVPEKTAGWFRWIFPFPPPIWKGGKSFLPEANAVLQAGDLLNFSSTFEGMGALMTRLSKKAEA